MMLRKKGGGGVWNFCDNMFNGVGKTAVLLCQRGEGGSVKVQICMAHLWMTPNHRNGIIDLTNKGIGVRQLFR